MTLCRNEHCQTRLSNNTRSNYCAKCCRMKREVCQSNSCNRKATKKQRRKLSISRWGNWRKYCGYCARRMREIGVVEEVEL